MTFTPPNMLPSLSLTETHADYTRPHSTTSSYLAVEVDWRRGPKTPGYDTPPLCYLLSCYDFLDGNFHLLPAQCVLQETKRNFDAGSHCLIIPQKLTLFATKRGRSTGIHPLNFIQLLCQDSN